MHNPTTSTQSPSRRKAVAEIIRKAGTLLIEDDAYGFLDPSISPIANLIPERTYLAVSLSKCIAPALRISFLLTPDVAAEQMLRSNLQATTQMAPPLMLALVMHWLRSGVADQIVTAIRNEAIGRQQLAAKLLKGHSFAAYSKGHHLWLSLPRHWNREDFVAHVLREGLAVVPSEAFAVDRAAAAPHAVRVSLGAARNRTELSTALHLLAAALKTSTAAMQIV
jgi:DNA-binding transcriptional MocR family regulator